MLEELGPFLYGSQIKWFGLWGSSGYGEEKYYNVSLWFSHVQTLLILGYHRDVAGRTRGRGSLLHSTNTTFCSMAWSVPGIGEVDETGMASVFRNPWSPEANSFSMTREKRGHTSLRRAQGVKADTPEEQEWISNLKDGCEHHQVTCGHLKGIPRAILDP